MKDGTYLKLGGHFHRIENESGYWVASTGATLGGLQEGDFLGIWTDENGWKNVEKAHFFTSLENAKHFGRLYKQRAIWDCRNAREIWLDKVTETV